MCSLDINDELDGEVVGVFGAEDEARPTKNEIRTAIEEDCADGLLWLDDAGRVHYIDESSCARPSASCGYSHIEGIDRAVDLISASLCG